MVERKTKKTQRNTKNELKAMITAAFINLNKETFGKARRRFRSRLEAILETDDNFCE